MTLTTTTGLVLDGKVEEGGAGSYPVTNPVRPAEIVLEAPAASADQLDRAVGAARREAPGWALLPFDERARLVTEAAARAAETGAGLAELLTREHGKILLESVFDTATIGGMAAPFAPLAAEALAPHVVAEGASGTRVAHEPVGVVAAVLPFNWPVAVMANKVLPALLTGNTVVVKAPPTCPGAVLAATAALAEALPPGVVNVLNGPGRELGEALVAHPDVDLVSFTGGPSTGQAVMAAAARRTTPVVLELGGNDPAVLAPDVVVDDALADQLVSAAFVTSGQVCMAVKRLYVPEERLGEVVEALVARLAAEVVGDGLVEGVTMGPVHQAAARERVERMVSEAAAGGGRVHRPATVRPEDEAAAGYLVSPALVESPPPDSALVRQEQFAPALPVLGYRRLDDAVAAANDTEYGLCASIWTGDDELAASVARRLQAGTVFVNCHGMSAMDYRAPMGGWKESGFGVELGSEGMRALTRPKTILTHGLTTAGG